MNMKKTISILILLILIPTLCFAGALQEKQRQVIAKKNTAGGAKTIAHVNNDNCNHTSDEGTTIAMDSKSHTTGNTIIVFVYSEDEGYHTASPTVSSITDTASNTYTKITSISEEYNRTYEMWYATNITGNASNIISVVWSASTNYKAALSMEFSGLGTGAVDVYEEATGTGTESSVSVTNTTAVTACMVGTENTAAVGSASAGSGYTLSSDVGYATTGEFKVTSSTGTQVGSISGLNSGTWYTIQACLK
jgi:hypothetical protein